MTTMAPQDGRFGLGAGVRMTAIATTTMPPASSTAALASQIERLRRRPEPCGVGVLYRLVEPHMSTSGMPLRGLCNVADHHPLVPRRARAARPAGAALAAAVNLRRHGNLIAWAKERGLFVR